MPAHGQKTRHLDRPPSWRRPDVTVDIGTWNNEDERLSEKYVWFRDKYWMHLNEVAGVGAVKLTFDFVGVPKAKHKTIHRPINIAFIGYYTGNHATPQAPKFQIYDWIATDWTDITGMVLSTGQSAEEWLSGVVSGDGDWWEAGTNTVRLQLLHPVVGGNPTHELHINHVGLAIGGVTTTTSTTSTTTTTV